MPLDDTRRAQAAQPATIQYRAPGSARLQSHAAWRIPSDDAEAPLIDRLHAAGMLDARQYANACAVARLYEAAGLGRSRGVASYIRRDLGHSSDESHCPEDDLRSLIANGGVGVQAVLMLVRGECSGPYILSRAKRALDALDHVAAEWDGERYQTA